MVETGARKVAICLPNLGGGGAERVVLTLAADLAARGHKVDLVLIKAVGELLPLVPDGVRVVDLKAHRILGALLPLTRYLREERPDALHAQMWPVTVIAIMAHRLARSRAKLVISEHTTLSRQVRGGVQRRLLEWTTRFFYPLADVRTACSAASADDLAELSGIARDRIEVVYNPISLPRRIAVNPNIEAFWKGGGPRIITVGSLSTVKNQALLLRAFARLADQRASLVILGEGELRLDLERLAAELGIADRLAMPGFVIDPWPYLAMAQLFVLSSDYEGFPLALVEAMHVGLKIVSTDCLSGPSEILDNGRYGRLVPCGDADALAAAMDAALADPADSNRMQGRAAELSGPRSLDRFVELLTA
jgi:glycosyltransferase involved in cell wall biosynthesis